MKKKLYLPNTIVIGPQRCGTTWLHNYLQTREDVLLPKKTKETHFFDTYYSKGLNWYRSFFENTKSYRRVIEVAPTYFEKNEVTDRIRKDLGIITIICTLRNPVIRAFSLYLHLLRFGYTSLDFRSTVDKNTLILNSSLYSVHLDRWIKVFGRENVLIVFYEDLKKDQNNYIKNICTHLNIPYMPVHNNSRGKIGQATLPKYYRLAYYAQRLSEILQQYRLYPLLTLAKRLGLRELFYGRPGDTTLPELSGEDYNWFLNKVRDDIDNLENMLSMDLHEWKKQKS